MSNKMMAGMVFPRMTAKTLDGEEHELGKPGERAEWRMLVVFRGKHCPLCTKYLNKIEKYKYQLGILGVDLLAVSGDSKEQLEEHQEKLKVSFPLCYGLTLDQMHELGLYISHPRSEKETDHPFPEPGIFVINENNKLHVVDISNNPFVRPELEALVAGLEWIKNPDNDYPIRGTHP